jgi:hypothetical protein
MSKVTLTNDFHGTSVTVVVPADGLLSARQTRKVRQTLCGMNDCTCGGIRGPQSELPDNKCCDTYSVMGRIVIADRKDWRDDDDILASL